MKELKYKVGDRVMYIDKEEKCTIIAISKEIDHPYIVNYSFGWPGTANEPTIEGKLNPGETYHYVREEGLSLIQSAEPQIINEYQIF